ncbi:hypothetical protein ES703_13258 [subsurface metagenome]
MQSGIDRRLMAWLKDGPYRVSILKILRDAPMLSSELANKIQTHRSSTSRVLKKLKEKNLINGASRNSRTVEYSLTPKGRIYLERLTSELHNTK